MKQKEEMIVEEIQEIETRVTKRQYDIIWGDTDFIVEEVIERDEDGNENSTIEVVDGETKEENEKVLEWIEDNYDKINL